MTEENNLRKESLLLIVINGVKSGFVVFTCGRGPLLAYLRTFNTGAKERKAFSTIEKRVRRVACSSAARCVCSRVPNILVLYRPFLRRKVDYKVILRCFVVS